MHTDVADCSQLKKDTNKTGFQAGRTCCGRIERQGVAYVKIDPTKCPRSESESSSQACSNRLNGRERRLGRRTMKRPGGCFSLEPLSKMREGGQLWTVTGAGQILTFKFQESCVLLHLSLFTS